MVVEQLYALGLPWKWDISKGFVLIDAFLNMTTMWQCLKQMNSPIRLTLSGNKHAIPTQLTVWK